MAAATINSATPERGRVMFGFTLDLDRILPHLPTVPRIGSVIDSPDRQSMLVTKVVEIEPGRFVVSGPPVGKYHRGGVPNTTCFMFLLRDAP